MEVETLHNILLQQLEQRQPEQLLLGRLWGRVQRLRGLLRRLQQPGLQQHGLQQHGLQQQGLQLQSGLLQRQLEHWQEQLSYGRQRCELQHFQDPYKYLVHVLLWHYEGDMTGSLLVRLLLFVARLSKKYQARGPATLIPTSVTRLKLTPSVFFEEMLIDTQIDCGLRLDVTPASKKPKYSQDQVTFAAIISAVVISFVYQYLIGYVDRGGSKTYSSGSLEFRDIYVSVVLFQGAYVWIKFRRPYQRIERNKISGEITKYGRFEPRFKPRREKDMVTDTMYKYASYLPLGSCHTKQEAEIVEQIAEHLWEGPKDGESRLCLQVHGHSFDAPWMSDAEKGPPGLEKAKRVAQKTKEVFHSQFKIANPSEPNADTRGSSRIQDAIANPASSSQSVPHVAFVSSPAPERTDAASWCSTFREIARSGVELPTEDDVPGKIVGCDPNFDSPFEDYDQGKLDEMFAELTRQSFEAGSGALTNGDVALHGGENDLLPRAYDLNLQEGAGSQTPLLDSIASASEFYTKHVELIQHLFITLPQEMQAEVIRWITRGKFKALMESLNC